ncbi:MAG: ABC transporter ATP-binding protein [Propioniciclava sp.]|uniref:ABC transporter ATP-binding protein n=1 Tax=Propioniciclava sp. TaxID=2038686 RepID=UPI0039E71E63
MGLCASYHGERRAASTQVLHEVDLTVRSGELLAVLGPSGCGKTTLLRVIAGLHPADGGRIELGGRLVCDRDVSVPPERRGVGLVPQDSALFPHRDVAANIEFGLRSRRGGVRLDRAARRERVRHLLDLVDLPGYGHRYPHELSGGERQRVALARALAPEPAIVLLDEAFGALDASLRAQVRTDVRAILRRTGSTAILVTHDQDEALSIADRIAVLRAGRVAQVGSPRAVYERPADAWTARFLGECSVLPGLSDGRRATCAAGSVPSNVRPGPVEVLARPEQIALAAVAPSEPGVAIGTVLGADYRGRSTLYRLQLTGGEEVVAHADGAVRHEIGTVLQVSLRGNVHVLPIDR